MDVAIEEKIGSHDRCVVVLRTLEFCANKAYTIHRDIVGKDTEVRESGYEFMEEMVELLPVRSYSIRLKFLFIFSAGHVLEFAFVLY